MLLYNNRGSLRTVLQLTGSVIKKVAITTVCLLIYGWVLVYLIREGHLRWFLDNSDYSLRNAYAPQAFGVLSAFAVCFRTNIAWSRYWEACAQTTQMFVKWVDAFAQIVAFCNTTISHLPRDDVSTRNVIIHWKRVMVHWFSLLAGFATERLINGDISAVEARDANAPWGQRVIRPDHLHALIHDGNAGARRALPNFFVYDLNAKGTATERHSKLRYSRRDSARDQEEKTMKDSLRPHKSGLVRLPHALKKITKSGKMDVYAGDVECPPIPILIALSDDERNRLIPCDDRGLRVYGWVLEGASCLQRYLGTPPPIFSRVYQELGSGNLGFHQALKLADVPFPFIFTQLLAWMLFFACLFVPVFAIMLSFQANAQVDYMTMVLSVMVCVPLVGLNEMAKELENPFGMDPNDVPLMEGLECFVESLVDLYFNTLPSDLMPLSNDEEKAIHQAVATKLSATGQVNTGSVDARNTMNVPAPLFGSLIVKLKSPVFQSLLQESEDEHNHEFLKNLAAIMDDLSHISSTHLKETVRKVINANVLNYKNQIIRKSAEQKEHKESTSPKHSEKKISVAFHSESLAGTAAHQAKRLHRGASKSPSSPDKKKESRRSSEVKADGGSGSNKKKGSRRSNEVQADGGDAQKKVDGDPDKELHVEKRQYRAPEEDKHSPTMTSMTLAAAGEHAYPRSVRGTPASTLGGIVDALRSNARDDAGGKSGRSQHRVANSTMQITVEDPPTAIDTAHKGGRQL